MPTYNRPHTLAKVLDSIRASEGHDRWTLAFSCEPGCPEVQELAKAVDWMPMVYSQNAVKMGIRTNTFLAANLADRIGAEFTLYLEDDVIISPDALLMCEWFSESYWARVEGVIALRKLYQDPNRPKAVTHSNDGLLGCGWGWHRRHWEPKLRGYWLYNDPRHPIPWGWDLRMAIALEELRFTQLRPWINRSCNIGHTGGEHNPPGWFDPNQHGACYSGPNQKDWHYG